MDILDFAVARKLGIAFSGGAPSLAILLLVKKLGGGSGGSSSSGGNISGDGSDSNPYAVTVPVTISASVSVAV